MPSDIEEATGAAAEEDLAYFNFPEKVVKERTSTAKDKSDAGCAIVAAAVRRTLCGPRGSPEKACTAIQINHNNPFNYQPASINASKALIHMAVLKLWGLFSEQGRSAECTSNSHDEIEPKHLGLVLSSSAGIKNQ
jgi:hypothetical protein